MNLDSHIISIADGITAGRKISSIGPQIRDAVWAARSRAEMFQACRVIMERFPGEFPLHGERAAE